MADEGAADRSVWAPQVELEMRPEPDLVMAGKADSRACSSRPGSYRA